MSYIDIVPIGEVEETLLLFIKQNIFQTFKIQTRILNRHFDLSPVYDPARNQYNSTGLLLQLINDAPLETSKILGVTELDLFIPIFTFLFGEAQLNGIGALVSTHRLHNQFYGIPEDEELLKDRLLKEGIHELGHTFGLIHCFALKCVMKSSTYVEEIDQKSIHFCRSCEQEVLHWRNGQITWFRIISSNLQAELKNLIQGESLAEFIKADIIRVKKAGEQKT